MYLLKGLFYTWEFILSFLSRCGYATLHSVEDKSQEDRMESFFLSETMKYLYLVSEIFSGLLPMLYLWWGEGHLSNFVIY